MQNKTIHIRFMAVLLIGIIIGQLFSSTALAKSATENITAYYKNIKIVIDGVQITPEDANGTTVEPFVVNGTTYLPVRAISNALGKDVNWDGDTYTIYITSRSSSTTNSNTTYEIITNSDEVSATIKATANGVTVTKTFEMSALIAKTGVTTMEHLIGKVAYISESGGEYYGTHFYALVNGTIEEVGTFVAPIQFPY